MCMCRGRGKRAGHCAVCVLWEERRGMPLCEYCGREKEYVRIVGGE